MKTRHQEAQIPKLNPEPSYWDAAPAVSPS